LVNVCQPSLKIDDDDDADDADAADAAAAADDDD